MTGQSVEPNKMIRFRKDGRIMRGDEVVGAVEPNSCGSVFIWVEAERDGRKIWNIGGPYRNKTEAKAAAREALS